MLEAKKSHEIDIIGLLLAMLKSKKKLAICLGVALVVGVVVALNTPKQFTSSTVLAPELSSGSMSLPSNLSDMASSLGIDIGGKSSIDAIYPDIYPSIVGSDDFIMGLFSVPVRLKDNDSLRTYKYHLLKDQRIPFWSYPGMWISNMFKKKNQDAAGGAGKDDPLRISRPDMMLCEAVRGAVLCVVDKKTSVITLSVTDQDPMVATILVDTIQSRLQAYITNYRTKKARNDMEYYKKLMLKAKSAYEKERRAYAGYSDANTDVILESYKSKAEDMENDMQLKYNSYTQLNAQYQLAAAKVQERTPAFTIIQKPLMPYQASSTPRSLQVLGFLILGFFADAIWVIVPGRKKKETDTTK